MARILVADDSAPIRDLICMMLADAGHEARSVENAAEAVATLERLPFDILLLDQNMPGLTGIETTAKLRADPRYKTLKIVILSADTRLTHGDASMIAGADAYLDKPLTVEKLNKTINAVLGAR